MAIKNLQESIELHPVPPAQNEQQVIKMLHKLFTQDINMDTITKCMNNILILEVGYTNPILFTPVTPTDVDSANTQQATNVIMQNKDRESHPP